MAKLKKLLHLFCITGIAQLSLDTADASSNASALLARYAGKQANQFRIEKIPASEGYDVYEVESVGSRTVLRGSSEVAIASALYRYLTEYCHAQMTWNGDNLTLPGTLPTLDTKVRVISPFKIRLAYNYCTYGYTMPFWDRKQWTRELDWLALHGINAILLPIGQEAVWQNTFSQFQLSREDIRQWLSSPVHQPWQFMQNMEGVLSPPQSLIDDRAALGKWLAEQCRQRGITPILQGYYGMVPSGFAQKYPNSKIFPQGTWAGNNRRPDMLDPGDPLFVKIAATFYTEQEKIFGKTTAFAADPFHEGGASNGMDRGTVYRHVQDAILAYQPGAILVKQCWQNSNQEMFAAGKADHSLALDLWADGNPFWRKANGYSGTPWAWCFLFNFGGNLALEGNPARLIHDFHTTLTDSNRRNLIATALVPEGSHTNPMMYELMTDMGWRGAPADLQSWLQNYLRARYGSDNAAAKDAWKIILETAYDVEPSGQGPYNSVITARPSLKTHIQGRTWAPGSTPPYESPELAAAWEKLLDAAPQLRTKDGFCYDLADVSRQVLVNLARPIQQAAVTAYHDRNRDAFLKHSRRFLALLADIDSLVATRSDWLMGAWVADARRWGKTPADQAYLDRISRMILTTWVENPETDLADYANREWSGLVGEYYTGRWKLFFAALDADLTNQQKFNADHFSQQRAEFERQWINSGKATMTTTPTGDTISIAKRLYQKYQPVLAEYYKINLPLDAKFIIGTWAYEAEGQTYLREFCSDGSVKAFKKNGEPLDWFDGFQWKIIRNRLILTRGEKSITLTREGKNTLFFASEGFGTGSRVR